MPFSTFVLDSNVPDASQMQDLPADPVDADPVAAVAAQAVFFRHYWDRLPCSYPDSSGDLDSVVLTSDHYSLRQLRSTGM